jgi:hypothetical protein
LGDKERVYTGRRMQGARSYDQQYGDPDSERSCGIAGPETDKGSDPCDRRQRVSGITARVEPACSRMQTGSIRSTSQKAAGPLQDGQTVQTPPSFRLPSRLRLCGIAKLGPVAREPLVKLAFNVVFRGRIGCVACVGAIDAESVDWPARSSICLLPVNSIGICTVCLAVGT